MSEMARFLLFVGLSGLVLTVVHRRAVAWADWDLLTSRVRRRVHVVQRRAPMVVAGSGTLAVAGLVLGVLA